MTTAFSPRPQRAEPAFTGSPAEAGTHAVHPFALVHSTTGGERLYALDAEAERRGLQRGQALADAKALEPDLRIAPAAREADIRLLAAFARGCGRWSPWTAPDPGEPGEDGVLLDVSGCARLFGGEERLLDSALRAVRAQGYTACGAIAPTIGLAWGLARHAAPQAPGGRVITERTMEALAPLPVQALRIGETAAKLRRFGLKRVGDIAGLPRASLARRFGLDLVRRLDQARGQEEEVLNPLQPKTRFRARLRYADALLLLDGIKQATGDAIQALCEQLEAAGRGAIRLDLHLFRVDGRTHLITLGTAAPARDARHLVRLFNEKLDRAEIDIGFGIETIELCARETVLLDNRQDRLDRAGDADQTDLARLTDQLIVRLGENRVQRAMRRQSHAPERAAGWSAAHGIALRTGTALAVAETAAGLQAGFRSEPAADRPLLVLARPEPAEAVAEIPDGPPRSFVWRRVRHQVHRAEGPERLAPEWWRHDPLNGSPSPRTRDYFRVETTDGRRFWLYRDGLYGLETTQPRWFVHGAT